MKLLDKGKVQGHGHQANACVKINILFVHKYFYIQNLGLDGYTFILLKGKKNPSADETELKCGYKLFRLIPGLSSSSVVLWDTCSLQSNCRTKAASDSGSNILLYFRT